MTPLNPRQWERAQQEMLKRWRLILQKLDAQDVGGVLALANMMDEFCEMAADERKAAAGDRHDPAVPVLKFPPDADVTGRCAFCRAFVSLGGCFGPLHALNRAILDGRWAVARKVAEAQLDRLRCLEFEAGSSDPIPATGAPPPKLKS